MCEYFQKGINTNLLRLYIVVILDNLLIIFLFIHTLAV